MCENKIASLTLLFWLLNDDFRNKIQSHQEILKQNQSET